MYKTLMKAGRESYYSRIILHKYHSVYCTNIFPRDIIYHLYSIIRLISFKTSHTRNPLEWVLHTLTSVVLIMYVTCLYKKMNKYNLVAKRDIIFISFFFSKKKHTKIIMYLIVQPFFLHILNLCFYYFCHFLSLWIFRFSYVLRQWKHGNRNWWSCKLQMAFLHPYSTFKSTIPHTSNLIPALPDTQ